MEIKGLHDAIAKANRTVATLRRADPVAGDLAGAIVELVESYEGRLSVAAAVGALELAKHEIMHAQEANHDAPL